MWDPFDLILVNSEAPNYPNLSVMHTRFVPRVAPRHHLAGLLGTVSSLLQNALYN